MQDPVLWMLICDQVLIIGLNCGCHDQNAKC